MKKIISNLLAIQAVEFESAKSSPETRALRAQIPAEMLVRFDNLLGRGKKGVALVQNGVCRGCQMQIPVGVVNGLIQGFAATICGNCGRYLYLSDSDVAAFQDRNKPEIKVKKVKAPSLGTKSPRVRKAKSVV